MYSQALKQTVSSGLLPFPSLTSMRVAISRQLPIRDVWNGLRLMEPQRFLSVAGRVKDFR